MKGDGHAGAGEYQARTSGWTTGAGRVQKHGERMTAPWSSLSFGEFKQRKGSDMRLNAWCLTLTTIAFFAFSQQLAHGQQRTTLVADRGEIFSLHFGPDGRTLASGDRAGVVRLWIINTRKQAESRVLHKGDVSSIAFSPDGRLLASACDGDGATVWNLASGEISKFEGRFRCAAFSPDAATLACGGFGGLQVFDRMTGKRIAELETGFVSFTDNSARGVTGPTNVIVFSPESKMLVSAGGDMTVRLWDVANIKMAKQRFLMGQPKENEKTDAEFVGFSSDGNHVVSAHRDGTIKLWNLANGRLTRSTSGGTSDIACAAMTPDGKTLACGSYHSKKIVVWNLVTAKQRTSYATDDNVHSIAISPDGKIVASGALDKKITLWNLPSDE